jgi:fatty acid amide hydrolase
MVDRAARRVDKGSAGLPVGVQVAAGPNREDLILAVMSAVETGLSGSVDYPRVPTGLPAEIGLSSRGAG